MAWPTKDDSRHTINTSRTDRDVHKAPALDFVGWYTLCPESGPLPEFVPIQEQAIAFYNDNAILLALHPELVKAGDTTNAKLPISLYESVVDLEHPKDDGSMQVDGEEESKVIRFRTLPFTIETDEAEMIAIDYVAKGAGSAAALSDTQSDEGVSPPVSQASSADKKGKKRANLPLDVSDSPASSGGAADNNTTRTTLSPEAEDHIASLTTRLNSVKMLQSRIALIRTFIKSLPP